ncbi:fibronectin type III domain-containing protein 7-like [Heptranchias perlo]|uniref:fibronectin type III domain-containing protein 7-like n=1 Tax=Heptranchias perlo TaxID=212740 RepID=UPI00355964FA
MFYIAIAEGMEGDRYPCNATETNCEITDLPCGQIYSITILAMDGNCTSLPSPAFEIQTAFRHIYATLNLQQFKDSILCFLLSAVPCIPQNVVAHMNCESNNVSVFWDPSNGTESYIVAAEGSNGHRASCNATDTECEIANVYCGRNYYITVQAIRMQCNSSQSSAFTIKTVPCVPQNVDAHVDCDAGFMSVSWELSEGATSYTATAEGSNVQQCSANDTLCDITDLYCGEAYAITVHAQDDSCDSAESPSIIMKIVSCIPQNLDVQLDCNTNDASVSWTYTKGAVTYSATAEGSDGHTVSCDTANRECQINDLHCGQMYNLTVIALDGVCDSSQSSKFELSSAPCAPQYIYTNLDCDTKSTSVSWEKSDGAVWYVTTAEGQDGHITMCNTTETHCHFLDLHCSQTYLITVKAMDGYCQSINTSIFETETVPCPPQNVQADCEIVTAFVTWEPSNRTVSYTATAEGSDGHTAMCTTSETNCLIPDLHCSQIYNISVLAFGENCSSIQGSSYEIQTAPCAPDEIIANVDCNSNRVVVSWGRSNGAMSYDITVEGSDGHTHSHNTTETRYEMLDLHCGQSYNITVTTLSYSRNGISSTSVQIQTAPCIPENLTAELNCDSNAVSFSWDDTDGAKLYTVTARDSQQVTALFNTSDTKAQIPHLQCGEYYTISVLATDNICRSPQSAVVNVHAGPCTSKNLSAYVDCDTNTAMVSWEPSNGSDFYIATAMGIDRDTRSCTATDVTCEIFDLQCGQSYSVTVVAVNEICNSSESAAMSFQGVPCAPQYLEADVDCANNSMLLSWGHSDTAISYMAFINASDEDRLHCDTTNISCYIQQLRCATKYNISVYAFDGFCTSMLNASYEVGTVPCLPEDIQAMLSPASNGVQDIEVSWKGSHCAEDYEVNIEGQIEQDPFSMFTLHSYWTPRMFFQFPVPCSSTYNISVTARNPAGISSPSIPITDITVPCSPNNLIASLENDTLFISWTESIYATEYIVYAVSNSERSEICRTPILSCEAPNVQKDMIEIVALNSAGESETSKINFLQGKLRDSPNDPFPTAVVEDTEIVFTYYNIL